MLGSDDECIAEYFMGFLELLAAASDGSEIHRDNCRAFLSLTD